jgi:hypothetical protein
LMNFFKGFGQGFKMEGFTKFLENLKGFMDSISLLLTGNLDFFKTLGDIIGNITGVLFSVMGDILGMVTEIVDMTSGGKLSKLKAERFGKMTDKEKANYIKSLGGTQAQDVIITKRGEIINTHPDDNIVASKGGGMGRSVIINNVVGQMSVTVTEGNAKQAGVNLISGLEGKIKDILRDSLLIEGAH